MIYIGIYVDTHTYIDEHRKWNYYKMYEKFNLNFRKLNQKENHNPFRKDAAKRKVKF